MNIYGLLPIGSVVLLKDSTKKLMITGVIQGKQMEDGTTKLYEYTGVVWPEGHLGPDKNYLFNGDQIDQLFFIGYQDGEALEFKEKADALLKKLHDEASAQ